MAEYISLLLPNFSILGQFPILWNQRGLYDISWLIIEYKQTFQGNVNQCSMLSVENYLVYQVAPENPATFVRGVVLSGVLQTKVSLEIFATSSKWYMLSGNVWNVFPRQGLPLLIGCVRDWKPRCDTARSRAVPVGFREHDLKLDGEGGRDWRGAQVWITMRLYSVKSPNSVLLYFWCVCCFLQNTKNQPRSMCSQ